MNKKTDIIQLLIYIKYSHLRLKHVTETKISCPCRLLLFYNSSGTNGVDIFYLNNVSFFLKLQTGLKSKSQNRLHAGTFC